MSGEPSLEARLAVIGGFAYASGKSGPAWAAAMDEGIRLAAAAMNGPYAGIAQAVLDSSVFKGEYRGYRLEETSKRLIVDIFTDNHSPRNKRTDGVEEIRTDRTDTRTGKLMQKRLDALPLGTTILAFKYMEKMSGSTDEARVMKHFEILASTGQAQSGPPEVTEQPLTRQASPPKPVEADPPPPSASAGRDDDPFNKVSIGSIIGNLPGPKAARLAKLARAEGIDNIMAEANAERVKELLATLE